MSLETTKLEDPQQLVTREDNLTADITGNMMRDKARSSCSKEVKKKLGTTSAKSQGLESNAPWKQV